MSWEEAINAAKNDQGYSLAHLTPEEAERLFASKIDPEKLDNAIEKLKEITASNNASARKFTEIMAIVNTVVSVGRIIIA
jgi:DNA-directed RNA polymerase subunit F